MINFYNNPNIIYKKKKETFNCIICNDVLKEYEYHNVNDCLFIKGTYKYRPIIKKRFSKYFHN